MFHKKERTGFGGGFKIPEDYRLRKEHAKKKKFEASVIEDHETLNDHSLVTKDEILNVLQLGNADGSIGAKSGANSKGALAKDLVEGMEKDLRKLKLTEENIRNRQIASRPGGQELLAETEQDRENIRIGQI